MALTLGRVTVLSALGDPLRAEIDIPSISNEEAASLKASVAPAAAFAAAGLEYNASVSGVQATLARRPDGRSYLRLSSTRAIVDPFVDLILEASWSSGRLVRDYTMLFEAAVPKPAEVAVHAPQAPAPEPQQTRPEPVASPPAPAPAPAPTPTPVPTPSPQANPTANTNPAQQLTVKAGQTAGQLALRAKAPEVSLDQMLVAMLRANPAAFSKGNVNRLRAGAVLELPSAEDALAVPAAEATQTVMAQSKDFNSYRRSLADNASKPAPEAPTRKASGALEATVQESKPGSGVADKLTLAKGAVQAKEDEAAIAKQRAEQDAATRAAELAKNIAELSQLSAASAAASAPAAAATPEPASSASAPATVAPQVEMATPVPPASEAMAASPPASAASAASAPSPATPWVDTELMLKWLHSPLLPMAGGGLLAALGAFFWYRRRQSRQQAAHEDSRFMEGNLQAESLFGAAPDAPIQEAATDPDSDDNRKQPAPRSDVDPVAEADVYLAYGRDVQAEDILKEARRHDPDRLAIHSKLLEVYAKRRDAAQFMASAQTALALTGADSADWRGICAMGLSIDPHNPLYQPPGAELDAQATAASPLQDMALGAGGLDLDFSAEEVAALAAAPSATQDAVLADTLDFDVSALREPESRMEPFADVPAPPPAMADLSFDLEGFKAQAVATPGLDDGDAFADEEEPVQGTPANTPDGMLEFDLNALSLDLDAPAEAAAPQDVPAFGDGTLQTKLALAEEFVSIGDQDGARALLEEVVAEASGELQAQARRALSSLG